MSDTIQFQLYSSTRGTLDLTSSTAGDGWGLAVYGYKHGLATPLVDTVEALVGKAVVMHGYDTRTVELYVGVRGATGSLMSEGGRALSAWHNATDAEVRYKPVEGAWACLPIINTRRGGGVMIEITGSPAGNGGVAEDEWNAIKSGVPIRWHKVTLTCHPFNLAATATTTALTLSSGVAALSMDGTGEAPCSVTVAASPIGKAIIHTQPSRPGFAPFLRAAIESAGGGSTAALLTGFAGGTQRTLDGRTATVDASALAAGGNVIVASLYNNTAAQDVVVDVSAAVKVSGVTVASATSNAAPVSLPASGSALVTLGGITLPLDNMPSGTTVVFTFAITGTTPALVYVDQAGVFPNDTLSALTLVDAGTATTFTADAGTTANDKPSWLSGTVPVAPIAAGRHVLHGDSTVTVVASGATPTATATWRESYHGLPTGVDPT